MATYIAIYKYTIEFNILNVFFCRRGLAIETPRLSKRLDLAVLGLCRVPIQYLAWLPPGWNKPWYWEEPVEKLSKKFRSTWMSQEDSKWFITYLWMEYIGAITQLPTIYYLLGTSKYPLVNWHSNGISPSWVGSTSSKGPLSIAYVSLLECIPWEENKVLQCFWKFLKYNSNRRHDKLAAQRVYRGLQYLIM